MRKQILSLMTPLNESHDHRCAGRVIESMTFDRVTIIGNFDLSASFGIFDCTVTMNGSESTNLVLEGHV